MQNQKKAVFAGFLQMSQGQGKLSLAERSVQFSVALIHARSLALAGCWLSWAFLV